MLFLPRVKPLDPVDFCRLYARKQPPEWGYKSSWRQLLARVCNVSDSAVQQWGKDFERCPQQHKDRLSTIHALAVANKALKDQGIDDLF